MIYMGEQQENVVVVLNINHELIIGFGLAFVS